MEIDKDLHGERCILRRISMEACTDTYVGWLNDPEVNRYLETKWSVQTLESVRDFVRSQISSPDSMLLQIISKEGSKHIGNIKLGPIHAHYQHADISYFIGEKTYWGKGIATEAIGLLCEYGFKELGLHRIEAGAYSVALGSRKALLNNGFREEAVFREQVLLDGEWLDVCRYGLLASDFMQKNNIQKVEG